MRSVVFFIILGSIPMIILLFSLVDKLQGKREKLNWRWAGLSFGFNILIYIGLSIYYKVKYGFPFFLTKDSSEGVLFVGGSILFVLAFAFLFVHWIFRKNNVPKSVYDPKVSLFFILLVMGNLFHIGFMMAPLGEKVDYDRIGKKAIERTDEMTHLDFPVVLSDSVNTCLRRYNSFCELMHYFYVKNNLEETKDVKLKIRVYDSNKELLKEIDSDLIRLKPGEVKLVTTEKTHKNNSVWEYYTFKTEQPIGSYEWSGVYWDVEGKSQ